MVNGSKGEGSMDHRKVWRRLPVAAAATGLALGSLALGLLTLGGCAVGVSADAGISVTPTTGEGRHEHHEERIMSDPYMSSSGRAETAAKQGQGPH
jgi:hypothetical protein